MPQRGVVLAVAPHARLFDLERRAVALYVAIRVAALAVLAAAAAAHGSKPLLAILTNWDGRWYAGIARDGYGAVREHPDGRLLADYAFYPLLPGMEWLVHEVTGLRYAPSGLLISCLAAPIAAWGIYRVTALVTDASTALLTVLLWGSLPVAAVQTMAYTESLFTALAAWALYQVLRERWVVAGSLAAAAALTRPTGVAVTIAVAVAAAAALMRTRGDDGEPAGGASRARLLACLGLCATGSVAYLAWVGWRTGSPLGYFDVTSGWDNDLDGGRAYGAWVVHLLSRPETVALGLLVAAGTAGLGWLVAAAIRQRLPLPLVTYGVVLVVLSFATSGYLGSKPRYLLPAFVLLVPIARWLGNRSRRVQVVVLVGVALGSIVYGSVWLLGPGPP